MKRALVFQHTPTEGPERIAALLGARGVDCDVRALYRGDPLPKSPAATEPVVVMGGPMGVGDLGDGRYPFLEPELEFLRQAVARDVAVLGICLGSQLLAAAAGARVYRNVRPGPSGDPIPVLEVGWGSVDFIGASSEPLLAGVGPRALVLHWHGDTFDLPAGAVHLGSTPLCRHQAFRLGRRQVGLQFHCELEAETIAVWAREDEAFVRAANGADGQARILADTERYYAAARPVWDRLLGNAIDLLLDGR